MSSAGEFLLPGPTLIVECLVFAVVLCVLSRFALPRLRVALELHHERLAIVDLAAAEALARRDAALAEAQTITEFARSEACRIIDRAHARHDELVAEGRRAGRAEYEWMAGRLRREQERAAPRRTVTSPVRPTR
jgi:F0F1-type ATP synthase membrane subunit b/b'